MRLRVHYTSPDRSDTDSLAEYRGTNWLRLGTGHICSVFSHKNNKPCPCSECDGKVIREHWTFSVMTAQHVVYNTQEANQTKVDLFYDDESCEQDGTMKSLWALNVGNCNPNTDLSRLECATHDEALAERIKYQRHYVLDPDSEENLNLRYPVGSNENKLLNSLKNVLLDIHHYIIIISHPHGQPKKITIGKQVGKRGVDNGYMEYDAATCPGSSGAPVFLVVPDSHNKWHLDLGLFVSHPWKAIVHSGSFNNSSFFRNHVNYGYCYHGLSQGRRYRVYNRFLSFLGFGVRERNLT